MGKPKTLHPPSRVDALPFPVFGLTWYGSAGNATGGSGGSVGGGSTGAGGCSIIAYCGGGGSAKTGVGNKIVVLLTTTNTAENGIDYNGAPSASETTTITATTMQRRIEISTGDALCFGVHAFCPPKDYSQRGGEADGDNSDNMVQLLACVGDEILLYGIPLVKTSVVNTTSEQHQQQFHDEVEEEKKDEAILLGKTSVGNSYGASVASYSTLLCRATPGKLIHCVAVGCENGTIVIFHLHPQSHPSKSTATTTTRETCYEFTKVCECTGHTKAICALSFHPRGGMHQLLSSAKDGTARIFNIVDGSEMSVMQCEVHDPKLVPPAPVTAGPSPTTTDPRMMKRPPQILVRGCAYGDLEGKIIYTVASGKRGPAYLTKWRSLSTQEHHPMHNHQLQQPQDLTITQEYRKQCSPVPISATSLSSDGSLLTLGSVEGSVLLYDLSTSTLQKEFKMVHDLPVTCVASRPIPNALYLPGELEEGVSFDAISASADNRLGRWTLQSKSRIAASSRSRSGGGRSCNNSSRRNNPVVAFIMDYFVRLPLLLTMMLIAFAVRDAMDVCRSEFSLSALVGKEGVSLARRCFYREVLWAEERRVSFVPE